MSRVVAVFNIDTNFKFKQRLYKDLEVQRQDRKQDVSFAMFMKHALQENTKARKSK